MNQNRDLLPAERLYQIAEKSRDNSANQRKLTRALMEGQKVLADEISQRNDTSQKNNQSSVKVSDFKVFESFQNQPRPATQNQTSNLFSAAVEKHFNIPPFKIPPAEQKSIKSSKYVVSSRELLSEPNIQYQTDNPSPTTIRLERKEQEYRTILNQALKAFNRPKSSRQLKDNNQESQDSNLYMVKQHQVSIDVETIPTEEKRSKKIIRNSGTQSTIGGRVSVNSSISGGEGSQKQRRRRSCCTVSSMDSTGEQPKVSKKNSTKNTTFDQPTFNFSKSIRSVRCLAGQPLPPVPRSVSRGKTPKKQNIDKDQEVPIIANHKSVLFKILNDIVLKYKTGSRDQTGNYRQKSEKKQMLKEMSLLAEGIMDQERQMEREREKFQKKIQALKSTITDQDLDFKEAESSQQKLQRMNTTLLKQNEDYKRQVGEMEILLKKKESQFESQKDQISQEQQNILIKLDEDRSRSIEDYSQHFQQKLQQIQAMNDQLNQQLSQEQDQQYQRSLEISAHQQKINSLENEIEELKQDLQFKTSADNLRLQMKLKVQEEVNNHLKVEMVSLTKKITQRFELLDTNSEVNDQEHQNLINRLQAQLNSTKQCLIDKDQELQDYQSQNDKKLQRKAKQFDAEMSDQTLLVTNLQNEVQQLKAYVNNIQNESNQAQKQLKFQATKTTEIQSQQEDKIFLQTKEEEIQMLWNVIRQINKSKGSPVNISQLEYMLKGKENILVGASIQPNSKLILQQRTLNNQ